MKLSRSASDEKSRLERLASRAWYVLAWERAWPSIAAALVVAAFFVAVSWLGLWMDSPRWVRVGGSALFLALALACFVPLALAPRISRQDRLSRLDRDSGLAHRPASSLDDRLANAAGDPTTDALWTLHRRRLERAAQTLKIRPPAPRLSERDKYAVRAAALIALAATAFVAGPEKLPRIVAAFDWRTPDAPSRGFRLDAWIDPPAYTGLPPIMLTGEAVIGSDFHQARRVVQAPIGSLVIVRSANVGGLSMTVSGGLKTSDSHSQAVTQTSRPLPVSDTEADAQEPSNERRWALKGDGHLALSRYGSTLAQFDITAIPDKPPTITLIGRPRANLRGSLTLNYSIADDYGVNGADARFADPSIDGKKPPGRPLVDPPQMVLSLPAGPRGLGRAETTADLSENPWAGAQVTMTLRARDDGGNEGMSDPVRMTLPQRTFTKPIARALVEQRRNLVLDPDRRSRVATAIDGLMIAPDEFNVSPSIYLGLTAISYRLAGARTKADLLSVADLMWEMAVRIEDGDVSQAERDLRAAQQQLRDALQRGAPDQEIRRLMDQLRAALDKFLQAFAQQQRQQGRLAQIPPNQRMVTQRDLQSMLDRLENMARSGDMADAQRLLDQLQNMLENLQTAQQGQPNSMAQQMDRELSELDRMTRQQQDLRDRTFQQSQGQDGQQGRQQESQSGQSEQELQREQEGLRQRLEALQRQMRQMGLDAQQGLGEADQAMREAEKDLGQGKGGQSDAVGAQGRALQALRRGAQSLAQQMQQNGMGMGQAAGPGQPGSGFARPGADNRGVDPLGREARDPEYDSYSRYDPLGAPAAQRAEQVLQELRRRLGNVGRPQEELDYFNRLLHPY